MVYLAELLVVTTVAAPAPEYWNGGGAWTVFGGTWRARGARAYNGDLGAEPPAGSRGREGAKPLKLKIFLALGRAMDRANLYPLQYFQQFITIR